jgi:hypothetical protein
MLGRFQSNPGMDHWKVVKKVLRYIQGTKDHMLTYKRTENLEVVGYSNADFTGWVDTKRFDIRLCLHTCEWSNFMEKLQTDTFCSIYDAS